MTATLDAEPFLPWPLAADVIAAAPVEPEAPLWPAVAAPAAADCASAAPPPPAAPAPPATEVSAVLLACPELAEVTPGGDARRGQQADPADGERRGEHAEPPPPPPHGDLAGTALPTPCPRRAHGRRRCRRRAPVGRRLHRRRRRGRCTAVGRCAAPGRAPEDGDVTAADCAAAPPPRPPRWRPRRSRRGGSRGRGRPPVAAAADRVLDEPPARGRDRDGHGDQDHRPHRAHRRADGAGRRGQHDDRVVPQVDAVGADADPAHRGPAERPAEQPARRRGGRHDQRRRHRQELEPAAEHEVGVLVRPPHQQHDHHQAGQPGRVEQPPRSGRERAGAPPGRVHHRHRRADQQPERPGVGPLVHPGRVVPGVEEHGHLDRGRRRQHQRDAGHRPPRAPAQELVLRPSRRARRARAGGPAAASPSIPPAAPSPAPSTATPGRTAPPPPATRGGRAARAARTGSSRSRAGRCTTSC